MSKLNYGKDLKDWRAAFAVKDAGNSWNLSQSSDEGGDIYAPGSMPVDWNRRKVPALLEWRNPWYSHEPRTSERILPEMSSWKLAPRTSAARPRASGNYHHLELSCDGTRSSQAWTVALCALLGCRDPHELRVSLDLVNKAAFALMPPELGLAYADFEAVIQQKRETSAHIFTSAVEALVVAVAASFTQEATACLPLHVMQFVLEFVDLSENSKLCAVSKDFREAAEGDGLWRGVYEKRFSEDSPKNADETGEGGPDTGGGDCVGGGGICGGGGGGSGGGDGRAVATLFPVEKEGEISSEVCGFKQRYNMRLQDPHVGDEVEVAWKGKFRLESLEVYDGTAWWIGQVVGKSECPGNYKIHYPGWESKWDEWVPRDRLRWGNERLARALKGATLAKGDSVEMWCQGLHVPGAWLEAVVHEVDKNRLYLGEILTSGHFWVDPKKVRLVKKGRGLEGREKGEAGDFGDMSPCRRRSILMQALDDAGFTSNSNDDGSSDCCSVM